MVSSSWSCSRLVSHSFCASKSSSDSKLSVDEDGSESMSSSRSRAAETSGIANESERDMSKKEKLAARWAVSKLDGKVGADRSLRNIWGAIRMLDASASAAGALRLSRAAWSLACRGAGWDGLRGKLAWESSAALTEGPPGNNARHGDGYLWCSVADHRATSTCLDGVRTNYCDWSHLAASPPKRGTFC